MKFYKNNAYPDINLHDCNFQIKIVDNNIQFLFPDGVGVMSDGKMDWSPKGMIQLSGCAIDELSIYAVKPFRFLGICRRISREISIKDLNKLFQSGGCLQVWNEYYADQQFIWKCAIYPYQQNKKWVRKYGSIEISAFTESPLEYYLDR